MAGKALCQTVLSRLARRTPVWIKWIVSIRQTRHYRGHLHEQADQGAIGGVMGAYIVLYPRVHVHMFVFLGFIVTTIAVPAVFMLGYWLLLQVIGGFASIGAHGGGTAFWAHVGGFAAGALLVWVFKVPAMVNRHPYYGWQQQQSPTRNWRRIR